MDAPAAGGPSCGDFVSYRHLAEEQEERQHRKGAPSSSSWRSLPVFPSALEVLRRLDFEPELMTSGVALLEPAGQEWTGQFRSVCGLAVSFP